MHQYIGFKINENEYTIPILKVREIINTPPITKLPQSPDYLRGVVNIRGGIVPVVDLRKLISAGTGAEESTKIIVITSGHAVFGMLVDSITSVINIEQSNIEPAENFMHENLERVEGVARLDDRLLIMLDTNKLVDVEDMGIFEETLLEVRPSIESEKVEVTKVVHTTGGDITVKEIKDAKDVLKEKVKGDESKTIFVDKIVRLLENLASKDYENAMVVLNEMSTLNDSGLFKEIGLVTRKLHDSIKDFKRTFDPRIKQLANEEVPNAVDSLEYVIMKTAEAANNTMAIVEKYISRMPEFSRQVQRVKSPKEAVQYLLDFRETLDKDLTAILIAQEYQDVTGQAIKKVIELVNDIETELVGLIAGFGMKFDTAPQDARPENEKMSQNDVEDLLKDFGF